MFNTTNISVQENDPIVKKSFVENLILKWLWNCINIFMNPNTLRPYSLPN